MPDVTCQELSRRSVLRLIVASAVSVPGVVGGLGTLGALGALAGCRGSRSTARSSAPTVTTPRQTVTTLPTTNPDDVVARRAADGERMLLAAYDETIARNPQLASALGPLRVEHATHLVALLPGATTATSTATSSATPSGSPPASASSPTPPPKPAPPTSDSSPAAGSAASGSAATAAASASVAAAIQQLAALEKKAAASRVDDVLAASGGLARLLACIGGAEAAHASLLEGLG